MKRWAIVAMAASMLLVAACGSSGSGKAQVKGMAKDEACGTVKTIQTDSQQMTEDVAAGKVDMGTMMGKMGALGGRLQALAGSIQAGELQDAVKVWATATSVQLTDPTPENQTATLNSRDHVDDVCGLPHGPR